MKSDTKNQVKGTFKEMKGKTKETTGKVTGNDELEVEGKVEKNLGKGQKKAGEVEKDLRD